MFKIVADLLLHRQIVFEKGKISLFDRSASLLPTDSFVSIQSDLEKLGKENIIYYAGKESGKIWFKEMHKEYSLKGQDVIKIGSDIVTLAGWGEAIIKKRKDSEKLIVFELIDSTVVKLYGNSEYAVDHLFRGLLCGAMCTIFGTDMDCVETKCRAKGDLCCEFIVKPADQFDYTNPLTKKQLSR
jgi:predicted hydrocarbon binding protein